MPLTNYNHHHFYISAFGFGSLSSWKSQSVGSQVPEWDLVLALTSITWPWFSGSLASWETPLFVPEQGATLSLLLYSPPIWDLDVSTPLSLINHWWYRTPPWVKTAWQWIIDKLDAIKSMSLKGSGHVTSGMVLCRITTVILLYVMCMLVCMLMVVMYSFRIVLGLFLSLFVVCLYVVLLIVTVFLFKTFFLYPVAVM